VRRSLGLSEATFVVGWAGRLTAIKRPLDLVRVLAALVGRGVDAALVLVGDGPDRPAVEALGAELGVAGRVRLAGYRKEIADWHAAFDALLLTSANEGTPVAALEALASGRPVVATRVGGVPAVVEDAETGFLADVGDVEGLARGLEQLARDPEERRRMGAVGTERVRERFGRDRMVDDIEALYRRLLAR
jgi:glycosyltransferase involved in cell wall biosynthesis